MDEGETGVHRKDKECKQAGKNSASLPEICCVDDHASFFVDNFNYIPHGKAGARGSIFALFRDDILPTALRMEHVRSDVEGDLSTNQSHTRLMKRVRRNNGQVSARSIQ